MNRDAVTALTACGMDLVFGSSNDKSQKTLPPSQIQSELESIFNSQDMYELTNNDIQIDYRQKLGEGAFCTVYPVHIRNAKTNEFKEKQLPPFALKKVRYDLMELQEENPGLVKSAYDDLVQEATIMKQLLHVNILQMIGCAVQNPKEMDKFFIVIVQLDTTLEHKLTHWSKVRGPFRQNTPKETVLLRFQEVAIPLANALDYMHNPKQGIIYRDLKPANIGFDASGRVKLFDFGLATSLAPGEKLRKEAGTIRYMAPEMRMGKEYSYPVDVYSYAILLWQIITSRLPLEKEIPESDFFGINPKSIPADKRPPMKFVEAKCLSSLLEVIWHTDPNKRLTFAKLLPELHRIETELENDCDSVVSKGRRRPGLGPKRRSMLSSMNNY